MIARRFVPLLVFALAGPGGHQNAAQWSGIVQNIEGVPSTCQMGETHAVIDPCLFVWGLLRSDEIDLHDWECRYVVVEGPLEDVEMCTVMIVQQISAPVPPCRDDLVRIEAVAKGPGGSTIIEWDETVEFPLNFPCREGTYDVIRGLLPLSADETTVDLGAVLCIEEDTELESTIDATPAPGPGLAYFYLVRPNGLPDFQSYGGSTSGQERIPATGDCAQ